MRNGLSLPRADTSSSCLALFAVSPRTYKEMSPDENVERVNTAKETRRRESRINIICLVNLFALSLRIPEMVTVLYYDTGNCSRRCVYSAIVSGNNDR